MSVIRDVLDALQPEPPRSTLQIDVRVDFQEMEHWPPQTVKAFMAGLAQCIAAAKSVRATPAERGKQP